MSSEVLQANLNTSYVKVQFTEIQNKCSLLRNLNTSYVKVQSSSSYILL